MNDKSIQTCVSLEPVVKSYLEETTKDPKSSDFGRTKSHIINAAIAEYANRYGFDVQLRAWREAGLE